jgi:hypothetical protein
MLRIMLQSAKWEVFWRMRRGTGVTENSLPLLERIIRSHFSGLLQTQIVTLRTSTQVKSDRPVHSDEALTYHHSQTALSGWEEPRQSFTCIFQRMTSIQHSLIGNNVFNAINDVIWECPETSDPFITGQNSKLLEFPTPARCFFQWCLFLSATI